VKNSSLTKFYIVLLTSCWIFASAASDIFAAESVFARLYSLTVLWIAYNSVP
jgi:hypothetical protein